jgi:hypothetical protein
MHTNLLRTAGLLAVVAFAACDEDSTAPVEVPETLNDDVALLVADAVQEDLDVMDATVPLALSAVASPPVAENVTDFFRSRVRTFFDAEGNEQDGYDPLTTASINTVVEMSGELSRSSFEWSIDRNRDVTVTGLEGEETERTWNGEGSENRSRAQFREGTEVRTYDFSGSFLIEDVVRGVPRSENPWPLSGTITRNVTIEFSGPNGERSVVREVVVTFNGTQFVTISVNGEEYEFDLASRDRDRVRRRDRAT